ncbi:MAG: sulfurtransferase [Chloroflexota bacterium]|nr:sulfurtransferase [Chloroflexota bacterium]
MNEEAPAVAEYGHPEALATTAWLAAHLDDPSVRVVDMRYSVAADAGGAFRGVSGRNAYHQGHIPGAVFVDVMSDLSDPEDPLAILSPGRFEALMGRLGIGSGSTVVVYDGSGGTWAARLWWALRYYGHDDAKILDGGLTTWLREGRPLETRTLTPPPGTFRARPRPALRATSDEVVQAIGRRGVCIVDALPEVFYSGKARLYRTHRAGHIPTALNVPATANVYQGTQTLLPADALARLWQRAGLKPDQRVITYCGGGVYGAYDLFVLYVLGHEKVSLYDGSWMEWGANPDLPVETGPGEKMLDPH